MRIEFNPEPANLARPAAIAVTSRNGVRALAAWRAASAWRDVPVYAVGTATADCARDAGFSDVHTAAGDAAALAALLRAEFDPRHGAILYLAARDRAAELAELLPGFAMTTVEAYRGKAATALNPPVADALRSRSIDGVLLFSRRTAQIFANLVTAAGLAPRLTPVTLYALSPQVAEPVAALGARVVVAPQPEEAALLGLLHPALAHLR
jgi:uroporphyrinogen-III synthase